MTARTSPDAEAVVRDPRWAAVLARDRSVDGRFFYSVKTTGVYCRPSCGSRTARPENIAFHASAEDAERAGFRPCLRCRPRGDALPQGESRVVAATCRYIEAAPHVPTLDELARHTGTSAWRLHRVFKAATGLTPRAYAAAHRAQRLREALPESRSVTAAAYDAGFNSSGRFYAQADAALGMSPRQYRHGGAHADIRFAVAQCSLGAILVASSERGVCAIALGDDPDALARALQDRFPRARMIGGDAEYERTVAAVIAFVEAPRLALDLPLDVRGTAFQQRVWQALRAIPAGETVSYTELARRLGVPKSVRAVASACAANTLAVAIPCHRVVRTDGSLSGYRWGVERKAALLARERTRSKGAAEFTPGSDRAAPAPRRAALRDSPTASGGGRLRSRRTSRAQGA